MPSPDKKALLDQLRAADHTLASEAVSARAQREHRRALSEALAPPPRRGSAVLWFGVGATTSVLALATWVATRNLADQGLRDTRSPDLTFANYRVVGRSTCSANVRTTLGGAPSLTLAGTCELVHVVQNIQITAYDNARLISIGGEAQLVEGRWSIEVAASRPPATAAPTSRTGGGTHSFAPRSSHIALPKATLNIGSGRVEISLGETTHAVTITRGRGRLRFDGENVHELAMGTPMQWNTPPVLETLPPAQTLPPAYASPADHHSTARPTRGAIASAKRTDTSAERRKSARPHASAAGARTRFHNERQPRPASALAPIIGRVNTLRAQGRYAAAHRVLTEALEQKWGLRTTESLHFELGDVLASLDQARACRHWATHRKRFPQGRYASMARRSSTKLNCDSNRSNNSHDPNNLK